MNKEDRLYAPFVKFVTLRHRNSDGTLIDCEQSQWKGSWQEITETVQGTNNEAITVTSRTWRLYRKGQPDTPNTGDQIVDRLGQVWEINGPIQHRMRNQMFLCPTIQGDMMGKLEPTNTLFSVLSSPVGQLLTYGDNLAIFTTDNLPVYGQ